MANILIISAVFPPEPVVSASISADLAEELSKKYTVTVLRPKPTRPLGFNFKNIQENIPNYNLIELSSFTYPKSKLLGRLFESFSMGINCSKYIRNNKHEIRIIYNGAWPLLGQYLISRTARKYGISVVLPVQDIYPESILKNLPIKFHFLNTFLFAIDKYILNGAAKIIVISEKMQQYIVDTRNIEKKEIIIIRNWQNEEPYLISEIKRNQKSNNVFTFMYLGSISPSAGVELLINSFASSKLVNTRLVIAGNGSSRDKCVELANTFWESNIEFWDALLENVPEIQAQADVMLLPLKQGVGKTASPSKLTAYLLSKKPIIACVDKGSDTENVILSCECGWVLPPENINELAVRMKLVAAMPCKSLEEKGKNGFDYAIKNLSRKNNLSKLVAIFDEIVAEIPNSSNKNS